MPDQEILDELRALTAKVDRVYLLIAEMQAGNQSRKPRKSKARLSPPTPDEVKQHQSEFRELYEQWLSGDELGVQNRLDRYEVEDLRRFADSNNLNVTSKMSRERVLQLIGARFREKKQLEYRNPSSASSMAGK